MKNTIVAVVNHKTKSTLTVYQIVKANNWCVETVHDCSVYDTYDSVVPMFGKYSISSILCSFGVPCGEIQDFETQTL